MTDDVRLPRPPARPVPIARSDDGRSFEVVHAGALGIVPGALVVLDTAHGRQIGLIEHRSSEPVRLAGRLLGVLSEEEIDDGAGGRTHRVHVDLGGGGPFESATVHPVDAAAVEALHATTGAELEVGIDLTPPGGAAKLLPSRFNRHTFWCGQSGSGKTYALGVVLEQLIAHTALPIVIFDPNSDFVRLGDLRPEASGPTAEAIAQRDIRVLRPVPEPGETALRARYLDLPVASKAAILQLDPITDRVEYHAFMSLREHLSSELEELAPAFFSSNEPGIRALAERLGNLGVLEWEVWARDATPVTEVIAERPDATVLDLGGFSTPEQRLVVALAVLDDLWARREERRPVLLVIDEAHNLASPQLDSAVAVAVRERLLQIAAEGRKYGLWLLLSTQRPSKVHPGILSQCDNLALMKMTSPIDLDELGTYFGYAPEALLRSPWFRQGEALFAGGFVPTPTVAKMNARLTHEGGSDVKVPLR